jgi:hypothetical protein
MAWGKCVFHCWQMIFGKELVWFPWGCLPLSVKRYGVVEASNCCPGLSCVGFLGLRFSGQLRAIRGVCPCSWTSTDRRSASFWVTDDSKGELAERGALLFPARPLHGCCSSKRIYLRVTGDTKALRLVHVQHLNFSTEWRSLLQRSLLGHDPTCLKAVRVMYHDSTYKLRVPQRELQVHEISVP